MGDSRSSGIGPSSSERVVDKTSAPPALANKPLKPLGQDRVSSTGLKDNSGGGFCQDFVYMLKTGTLGTYVGSLSLVLLLLVITGWRLATGGLTDPLGLVLLTFLLAATYSPLQWVEKSAWVQVRTGFLVDSCRSPTKTVHKSLFGALHEPLHTKLIL
jgi:hypothetical protein